MSGPTPRAPTLIDVPMVRARTIDALGIGAEAQLDQVRDRRPGGEPGRDAGEQAPDEQDGQPLPRSQKSRRHHHDRHGTEHHAPTPHACRDAGLQREAP